MICGCRSCAPSVDVVSPLLNDSVDLAPDALPQIPWDRFAERGLFLLVGPQASCPSPRLPVENTGSASTP